MYDMAEAEMMEEFLDDEGEALDEFDYGDEAEWSEGIDLYDEFEGYEAFDYSYEELVDADDAVTEALEAEDADEFFGAIAGAIPGIIRGAKGIFGKIGGWIKRLRARRRARRARGRQRADEADYLDALDELVDIAEDEDELEAVAPVIAGLSIRSALPSVAMLPRNQRKKLVKSTKVAAKKLILRQGA
ncbi:MAG: hypothetical protein ABF297_10050, partial [Thiogranum sp.]